jgi:glycosyltransferase involved in cell wall biosynthesis
MRILRLLTRLNLGGPARQALASDPILVERGHEVRLLAGTPEPGEGDLFAEFEARGLDVVRVRGLRRGVSPGRDVVAAWQIRREIAAFRPDVVHTHASKAGALGRRGATGSGGPARVHTFHGHVLEGYFPAPLAARLVALERRLAARTDRIVAVSHATADDLVRLEVVEEDKLVVIQPGIDLGPLLSIERPEAREPGAGEVRNLIGAGPEDVVVGVVGRLAEVKRPGRALEVFELLAERHPQLHVVFVGDGDERRGLERRIERLAEGVRRRAHLLGARADMLGVLADLDGVLLTSRAEGLPVALVEAAAAGLPAVATDVGGVSEVLVHERTGFVGAGVEELAFGLSRLVSDPRERRAMGARARMRVQREHSAARLADRLEELYRVVCAERAGRGPVLRGQG